MATKGRLNELIYTELREMDREESLPDDKDTALAQALANIVLDHVRPADVGVSVKDGNLMLVAFFTAEDGHVELAAENPEAARLLWRAAKTAMSIAIAAGVLEDTGRIYVHGGQPGVSGSFVIAAAI